MLAGDKINGMLVAEVKPDRVRLTLGDESEELLLKVGTNPRPTAPPAAPAAAAAAPPAAGCRRGCAGARRDAGAPAEPAQTLAERRRAARAAACEQQQQPAPRQRRRRRRRPGRGRSRAAAVGSRAGARWTRLTANAPRRANRGTTR